ncbi:hypothetical protein THOM_1316 [Trachipleistophora hominis]|uniref:Uncharacterized protein n=1 Tax=Trachipleistophora hominis TaxID=72359 RepID=L7JWQ7_TRAHO|nr:hypothetical protein THOM_1316 [Trachipleistophora hominis]
MLVKFCPSVYSLIYVLVCECRYSDYEFSSTGESIYSLTPADTEYVDTLYSDIRDYGLKAAEPSSRKILRVEETQPFDYEPIVFEEIPQVVQPKVVKLDLKRDYKTRSNKYDLFFKKVAREGTSTTPEYRANRHDLGSILSELKDKILARIEKGLKKKYSSKLWAVYKAISGIVDRLDDSVGTSKWKRLKLSKLLYLVKDFVDDAVELVKMVEKVRKYDADELETFAEGCDALINEATEIQSVVEDSS